MDGASFTPTAGRRYFIIFNFAGGAAGVGFDLEQRIGGAWVSVWDNITSPVYLFQKYDGVVNGAFRITNGSGAARVVGTSWERVE